MPTRIRLLDPSDAEALAALLTRNRKRLRPVEPTRPEDWFTVAGQERVAESRLEGWAAGRCAPFVILDHDEETIVGSVLLDDVVRGAFLNAHLGYWLDAEATGRGLASEAVSAACAFGFQALGLHRIQAAALPENGAGQRVLARCRFTAIGMAPAYLLIDGAWRDHRLFQLLAPQAPAGPHPTGAGHRLEA